MTVTFQAALTNVKEPIMKPAGFKPNARVPKLKVGGALVNKYTNLH